MPDHFMFPFAPLLALQAVADATTTLRVTQLVLAADFRHPAVLAKELATLDVLSGGRVEVGIGAAWKQEEFEQAGIPFDKASVRIERLEEYAIVLKGLFGNDPFRFRGKHFTVDDLDGSPKPLQRPRPPIMIGGGGPKLLAMAARQADIIQVLPSATQGGRHPFTQAAFQEKVDVIHGAAADRMDDVELGTILINVTITDDPDRALDELVLGLTSAGGDDPDSRSISKEDLARSPLVAVGTLEQVCDKLLQVRDTLGFTYFVSPVGARPELLGPVIERLSNVS